eukprot:1153558-Pelagomonas_calceolata.AAC.5
MYFADERAAPGIQPPQDSTDADASLAGRHSACTEGSGRGRDVDIACMQRGKWTRCQGTAAHAQRDGHNSCTGRDADRMCMHRGTDVHAEGIRTECAYTEGSGQGEGAQQRMLRGMDEVHA